MKQAVSYVDTCSYRSPGQKLCFLLHERSQDCCFLTKVNENMKMNICEQAKMRENNQLHLGPIVSLQHLVRFYFSFL